MDKLELTFAPDTAGDYLLICSCEAEDNSVIQSNEVRVTVDGSARGLMVWRNTTFTNFITYVMIAKVTLPEGARSIKIQHRSPSGGAVTSSVRNARIIAIRLSKFQFNYYAQQLTRDTTNSTGFVEFLTLSDTPAANQHLVLFNSINGSNSNSISVEAQYTEDDSSVSPTEEIQERFSERENNGGGDRDNNNFAFWKRSYTGVPVRWDIDYRVENGAATGAIDDASIMVIDLTDIGALGGGGRGGASSFNLLV